MNSNIIRNLLYIPILALFLNNVQAQECGFDEVVKYLKSTDTSYYKQQHQANLQWWSYWRSKHLENYGYNPYSGAESRSNCPKARIIIPVAVHIIHNGGSENITLSQAQNAIDAMNEHYANLLGASDPLAVNTGIQFVLARFDNVQNALTVHKKNSQTGSLMGLKMAGTDTFINIWVVKQILDTAGNDVGVNGYATYPGITFSGGKQGVVVRYNWFGKYSTGTSFPLHSRAKGDVLSHEVGHYLGLLHPFEGGCAGTNASTAYTEGDLCKDVPAVAQADTNYVGAPNTCTETYALLSWASNPPDQKQLFMDYTVPEFKTSFTNDQCKLMSARLEQYHPTLGSPLYMPAGYPDICFSAARIDGITGACKGDSIKLYTYNLSATGGSPNYQWKLYKGNTLITTYSSGPIFTYSPDTGIFTVYLQVNNSSKITYDTLNNTVEMLDCSKRLASTKGNWEFGKWSGLKFTPSKTIRDLGPWSNQLPSQINAPEASACMSDSLGNLLFYAAPENKSFLVQNGNLHIWGKNYIEIKGSPLDSVNLTAMQAALIVPYPDSTGKYYLLYNTLNADFCYLAVVDPSDSFYDNIASTWRFGRITRKNDFISLPDSVFGSTAKCGEVLSAVPQCNPKYHWLLLHNRTDGKLGVFSIAAGEPTYHSYFATPFTSSELQVIFNSQGTKFHFGNHIFNFNRSTGSISLHKQLGIPNLVNVWGAMWSADGNILYRTEGFSNSEFFIYQYDLQSGDTLLNRTLVAKSATYKVMQLGPDGRIYIATDKQPFLAEVQNAIAMNYNTDNDCKYEPVGVLLKKGTSGGTSNWASLPNLINAEKEVIDKAKITFTTINKNCKTVSVEPNICCASSYKWLWGDGQTTTGRTATHTYATSGIYTIGLVINNTDTVFRNDTAQFHAAHKIVYGSDTICNNAQLQEFSTVFRSYYAYQWKVSNGTISSVESNRVSVLMGTGSSALKVIITNSRNGCKDSATKTVVVPTPVANNRIDSSQILCNSGQLQNITGATPAGGNGSYAYTWYLQPYSGSWRKLSSTTQNLTALNNDSSYKYVRMVKSGTCTYPSNHLSKIWIVDLAKIQKRDSSCSIILETVNPNNFGISVNYQWEKSADSSSWSNVSGATTNNILLNRVSVSGYYRLKVTAGGCTVHSAGYKPLPEFTITQQPQNMVICNTMNGTLTCSAVNNYGSQIRYQWQKNLGIIGWKKLIGQEQENLFLNATNVMNGDEYRCVVNTACGQLISNIAVVGKVANPTLTNVDSTKTTSSGTPIKLKGEWDGERNVCYTVWQRSFNPEGGNWDSIGMTTDDSFTVTPIFTQCQQKMYYRIALRNLCPTAGKNYWNNDVKSKFIEVGSYQHTSPQPDVWIPDSRRDRFITQGAEPNWIDSNNYTGSYYLWNRAPDNFGEPVNDWLDRENVNADLDTNWIHTIVYNRGTDSVNITAKVYFYWTLMSTNEDWPYSWTGNAKFVNKDPSSGRYNDTFPLGGRINKTGVQISDFLSQAPHWPGHPPYNGKLSIGDSVLVSYPWIQTDTIPQPWWYHGTVNNAIKYANQLGLCLLARIQECDSPNYALSYPEKLNYGNSNVPYDSNYTANIGYNIVNNNNITSANFYLGYMNPPFSDTVQTWVFGAPIPTEDSTHERDMEFDFCVQDPQYYQNADVLITMCDEMWDIFNAANKPGVGFYSPAANQIVVTDPCAEIGPITVPDTFSTLLGFNFRYLPGSNQLGTPISSVFTLRETVDQSIETGSTTFGVHSFLNGNGQQNGGGQGGGEPSQLKVATFDSVKNSLKVFPNPFSNELTIEYLGAPNGKVQIELYDLKGSLVKTICNCIADAKGKTEILANLPQLTAGAYTIRVIENGKTKTEMVIRRN